MDSLRHLYTKIGRKNSRYLGGGLLVVLLLVGWALLFGGPEAEVREEEMLPTVKVSSIANITSVNEFATVGKVSALSEARLETEAGGRVTAVPVSIGQSVRAGQVIASLENSREQASLLQAQGSYEAALAGAQQGDSGVRDSEIAITRAEDSARSAITSSYTAVQSTLVNSIDQFFSTPDGSVPGLRIDGNTGFLNAERVAFQTLMPQWQGQINDLSASKIVSALDQAETNTKRTLNFLEQLITDTDGAGRTDMLHGQLVSTYTAGLLTQKATLTGTLNSIQAARTTLAGAKEAALRSDIGGTGATVSLANAQVKVALGNLRAAQSAYQKTLVRTPVSGIVNALYLKAGEYVSPGQPAAIVANNTNGLEIDTAITQEDALLITVGDFVRIEDTATGTITAIGGAVDPTTGKVAVKIAIDESKTLQNGSTVTVYFKKKSTESTNAPTIIPLSAIKMTGSGPLVFSVSDDGTLEGHSVTLGPVRGDGVVVESGVTPDMEIVIDARGLKAGAKVQVAGR